MNSLILTAAGCQLGQAGFSVIKAMAAWDHKEGVPVLAFCRCSDTEVKVLGYMVPAYTAGVRPYWVKLNEIADDERDLIEGYIGKMLQ